MICRDFFFYQDKYPHDKKRAGKRGRGGGGNEDIGSARTAGLHVEAACSLFLCLCLTVLVQKNKYSINLCNTECACIVKERTLHLQSICTCLEQMTGAVTHLMEPLVLFSSLFLL